jgi:glycosyltransferase involved in cell wall biosynthesis
MHAHFGWSGVRMLLLKQFLRIPLVVTFGGRDAAVQMHLPHLDRLYRVLLAACDQIICVSHDLKAQLVQAGVEEEQIDVIRRGTDLRRFAFVERRDRDPRDPVKLLMVGRLVEKKGHAFAFEAVEQLVREGLPVRLTVVGEGEHFHQLRSLRDRLGLRQVIDFAGVTDHGGVRQHMADADVFVHCSVTGADGDTEGIPNVVVEAAATGLPIVGTMHGGIVEPVRHGSTGLLVPERDVAALAEAMRPLIVDRARRLELGVAGSRFMRAEFDLDRQVDQHLAIYERLAATRIDAAAVVPPDFVDLMSAAFRAGESANEFSLAELFEFLLDAPQVDADALEAAPSLGERLYDLKRYIPQGVKFPFKYVAGKALTALIAMRHGRAHSGMARSRLELDRAVLALSLAGDPLDDVAGTWSMSRLAIDTARRTSALRRARPAGPSAPVVETAAEWRR